MVEDPSGRIDTSVPHSARIWNYWLGGKDNYPVDREAGDRYVEIFPGIIDLARHSRAFLTRTVRFLAGEAGIRQFLDIGTGLPTVDNTHQVAQRVAPESRIVYVDNDPLVLAHARALLTSTPEGACAYIDADLREPEKILDKAAETLDFSRPIGLMLMGILGHIEDYDEARSIVSRLLDRLPSTLLLVTLGILAATLWGLLLGATTVFSRTTAPAARALTSLGLSMPDFVLGVVLIYVFYFLLDWAPSPIGQIDLATPRPPDVTGAALIDALLAGQWSTVGDALAHLVLPVATMALVYGASVGKVAESAFLEARSAPFMDYARLSGLRRRTRARYLTLTSLPPTITYSGVAYAYMLGGVVLIETVFSWGGVAQFAASALANRDLNVIQGFVLIVAVVTFLIYLLLDIFYIVMDPRVRT